MILKGRITIETTEKPERFQMHPDWKIKLLSSIAINVPIIIIIIFEIKCSKIIDLWLFIGLIFGETLCFAHLWRTADSNLNSNIAKWFCTTTAHLTYAFIACVVFSLIDKSLSKTILDPDYFKPLVAFGVGMTIPTFPMWK